jgi:hypothetical protein
MLRRIYHFLNTIKPIPLGRWCLNDKSKNNWKIDMANTDHCGTCSYDIQKPIPKNLQPSPPLKKLHRPKV